MDSFSTDWELPEDTKWRVALGDDLFVAGTDSPDSPLLRLFFDGYDRAFILPDEKEELSGFVECLGLNPQLPDEPGRRLRELVIVLFDGNGRMLGGANFLAVEHVPRRDHPSVSVNLNYLFVDGNARGRGLSRALLGAVSKLACRAVSNTCSCSPVIFIEQNDPMRLSTEDSEADTAHSGMDQIDRLAVWARLGARVVNFEYQQPPLSLSQAPNDGLIYAAIDFPGDAIDACYLLDHLSAFFGVSVLKGQDPYQNASSGPQLLKLAELCKVGGVVLLLEPAPALRRLRLKHDVIGASGFRELSFLLRDR